MFQLLTEFQDIFSKNDFDIVLLNGQRFVNS